MGYSRCELFLEWRRWIRKHCRGREAAGLTVRIIRGEEESCCWAGGDIWYGDTGGCCEPPDAACLLRALASWRRKLGAAGDTGELDTHLGVTLSSTVCIHVGMESNIAHAGCLWQGIEVGGEAGQGDEVGGDSGGHLELGVDDGW